MRRWRLRSPSGLGACCLVAALLCVLWPVAGALVHANDGGTTQPVGFGRGRGSSDVTVLLEPDQGVRPLTRLLNRSQHRIFVETYILSDSRIVRALQRAAAQGVDVYVMLEPHPLGLGVQPQNMKDKLTAAGIMVRWSSRKFFLTHAKFMVLDDRLAIISTANFSRSAFTRNREAVVLDKNRFDVREVSNLFRRDWDRLPAKVTDPNLPLSPLTARRMLSGLIKSARRSIDIYAEEIADPSIEETLIRVHLRAVRVRLMLPPRANPCDVGRVLRGGVEVRENGSPYIHAKVISVDGREAFVGSENLSTTSLDRNRELGVLVRGEVVRRLARAFGRDWRAAHAPSHGACKP